MAQIGTEETTIVIEPHEAPTPMPDIEPDPIREVETPEHVPA